MSETSPSKGQIVQQKKKIIYKVKARKIEVKFMCQLIIFF
jgi:hypothetical protein